MNRSKLKTYAPKARRDFIQAVTDRAAYYGLTKNKIEPVKVQGDVAVIRGTAFPKLVTEKRKQLEERIARQGFEQVMEAVAYTWFNRLVAIRYMELHGYLDHGYRVLSHPEGKATPEIVEHAEHVKLPGLNSQRAIELKLDGTKESELFRMLLLAQCNALHSAMPFLFEHIDDDTELLLPDNLLHSDSIVRKLASEIDEADWQEVEIIGWLYEEYISERYRAVIGKVVKSEDIPAATQRFTPNWIVKYLVQNSLGRQWLATYPDSPLKSKWEYYIELAEQTPEVLSQLKEITPTTLNPEDLTILDPACGSGHILVEAYDLLRDIYLERGYRLRDIPRLILNRNVYGLEIDDRAAQLACFALLMKARADDRKIFGPPPQLNVLAIQETKGLDISAIVQAFTDKRITKDDDLPSGEFGFMVAERAPLFAGEAKATPAKADEQVAADLKVLLALFENAKTYGSLITVSPRLAERLPQIAEAVEAAKADSNLAVQNAARIAGGFVMAATLLAKRYDAVVANPPYMGANFYTSLLADFVERHFADACADLYSCFTARALVATKPDGLVAMITIPNWLFLPAFVGLRHDVLHGRTIESLIHNGRGVWRSDFGSCSFVLRNRHSPHFKGTFKRLFEKQGSVADVDELRERFFIRPALCAAGVEFARIPGMPIAYWASEAMRRAFDAEKPLSQAAELAKGLATGENERFLRRWFEVSLDRLGLAMSSRETARASGRRWFPHNKGGAFRRWYGNLDFVINWENDGFEIRNFKDDRGRLRSRPQNLQYAFREAITWSKITISSFSARYSPAGCLFDDAGASCVCDDEDRLFLIMAFLGSKLPNIFLPLLNPTLNYQIGNIADLPFIPPDDCQQMSDLAREAVDIAAADWNSVEESWEFRTCHLITPDRPSATVEHAVDSWARTCASRRSRMRQIEEANNIAWLGHYALLGEVSEHVEESELTLSVADKNVDRRRLVSFGVGCAMGRYSLDRPGLIYANAGNEGFDPSQYKTFPADPDGIIPITERDWFPDSAARRFEEFVGVAWPREHLEENLQFVADGLTGKSVSDPRETIRSYFANNFYKHHLQTYKKRPIYWLFCSGKQRAFQALVYLHRYHEGTLARMRTEYVIPLQGRLSARIDHLAVEVAAATATSHLKKLEKERDKLKKQQAELQQFDEKLKHYADMRIKLDLDDGVKVNYGKFGDLLAEVKAVTGEKPDED